MPVNTDALTTPITGIFQRPLVKDVVAGELFKDIRTIHYNINISLKDRDEQKRRLQETKKRGTPTPLLTHNTQT